MAFLINLLFIYSHEKKKKKMHMGQEYHSFVSVNREAKRWYILSYSLNTGKKAKNLQIEVVLQAHL